MCGIIGYIGPKNPVPILLDGLKKLEYRGYDSAGVAVVSQDRIVTRRVMGKVKSLEEALAAEPLHGSCGLGHTRWATHGRPSEENAHPHRDCTGTLAVIHNGIIENYLPLKEKLKSEGHIFLTETDTEVVVHLVEKYFRGSLHEAVRLAVAELQGAFALACLSARDPGRIVAARSGPPVVIGLGRGEQFVASDVDPLLVHTRDVAFLEDGEMAVAEAGGVRFFDFAGHPLDKAVQRLDWNPLMIEKRGYKHFMLKEIFEQPEVVRDTLLGRISLDSGRVFLEETGLKASALERAKRIVIIACGTSYHAGLAGEFFLESLARIPVEVEYASEFRYRDPVLDGETLVVVVSQSGETADTLAALRASRDRSAGVLAVTNCRGSSLAREAGGVLYTHAGPEIGVAATKTFTAQLTALALLALDLARVRGTLDEESGLALVQELQRLPYKMDRVLGRAAEEADLARRYLDCADYLYLGRWVNFPVALEGALKLKEISYTHAEGYAGGEMKHGPIALIDDRLTTVAIAPRDRVYDKILSNIAQVKARGGRILAVAFEGDEEISGLADEVIRVPAVNPLFSPFLTVLPLQLFAYYVAEGKGLDVDQPRNLAKSVTVE